MATATQNTTPIVVRTEGNLPEKTNITTGKANQLAEITGKIGWISKKTRPDIAYATGVLQRCSAHPSKEAITLAKHILKYLKGSAKDGLEFNANAPPATTTILDMKGLKGYVDSSFNNDPETRKSIHGWLWMFNGTPISWTTKRQSIIATSSTAAEYIAYEAATQEGLFLRHLLHEMGQQSEISEPTVLYSDSDNAILLATGIGHKPATKWIDLRFHVIKERIKRKLFTLELIDSKDNTADGLTKALDPAKFEMFRKGLKLTSFN
ncbi:hypothetical protein N7540_000176 [Penicillium herquei]|nr:hypothetical protein N7540_000176 [Penicillium herquei]